MKLLITNRDNKVEEVLSFNLQAFADSAFEQKIRDNQGKYCKGDLLDDYIEDCLLDGYSECGELCFCLTECD